MSLAELERQLPPPDAVHVDRDWSEVRRELGVEFAPDYRAVLERYGQGHFDQGTMLFDPRRRGFALEIAEVLEIMGDPELRYPGKEHPYPPHPGPGARLLPVGANGSGGYLFTMVNDGVQDEARYWLGDLDIDDFAEIQGPLSNVLVGLRSGSDRPSPTWRIAPPYHPL